MKLLQTVNTFTRQDRQFFYAGHRDPLAQSFTVDETGAFLTSFDVYFASKDPFAKLFVELRHVELGTPTNLLVQDYTQLALNPSNINVSDDASVPTTIKFLITNLFEPEKEYALVFLSPASDKYEMWVATMGQKQLKQQIYLMLKMLLYLNNILVEVYLNHKMVQSGLQVSIKI